MNNIIRLTPPLRVVEQSSARRHFPPVEDRPRVDVSGGIDGATVWLFGCPYRTGLTISNAARIASALMTLDALDALPGLEPDPAKPAA